MVAAISRTLLVGDAEGNKTLPSSIPAFGSTGTLSYRLRIPERYTQGPFKLIFVAKRERVVGNHDGDLDPYPYLYYDRPETRVLGFVEPNNGGL